MRGSRRILAHVAAASAALALVWAPALYGAAPASAGVAGTGSIASGAPTLWPLGDSITYGLSGGATAVGTAEQTVTPGGYRGMLDSNLSQDGVSYHFVGTTNGNSDPVLTSEGQSAHDGHVGYRVDQDAADLDGLAGSPTDDGGYWMTRPLNPITPDVVIVLLGGNDILQHYDPTTTFPTTNGQADYTDPGQVATFASDLTSRVHALLTKIESLHAGTRIVLCDTTPIGKATADPVSGPYGQDLAQLASQENSAGVSVAFVDIWSLFIQQTSGHNVIVQGTLGPDGEHPTTAGYQMIANALRAPVEQQLAAS